MDQNEIDVLALKVKAFFKDRRILTFNRQRLEQNMLDQGISTESVLACIPRAEELGYIDIRFDTLILRE